MLEEGDNSIRAYEENYKENIDIYTLNLLGRVLSEGGELTVRGTLLDEGIELDYISYLNYGINTNLPPEGRKGNDSHSSHQNFRRGYRY